MVAIGLLLFAGALAAATALVVQNRGENPVRIHAFAHTVTLQPYSILAAGAVIAVIALIGVAVMRSGAARSRQLRRERDALLAENARLAGRATGADSSFFFDTFADDQTASAEPSRAAYQSPARRSPSG